jgi:hypothetical protein
MPNGRFPIPYSKFIRDNFCFVDHSCTTTCNCSNLGCKSHYVYINGITPDKEQMRYMLATWQAFRAPRRNGISLMAQWVGNFDSIASTVKPLSNLTLLCDWENHYGALVRAFDQIKRILFGSVVCVTKTLHCLAPDLFLILDRKEVYRPWRNYVLGLHARTLPASIESVNGANYISFMSSVRAGLNYSIVNRRPLVLGQKQINVSIPRKLRYISPIRPDGRPPDLPNTIGKVLDNIVGNRSYED